MTALEFSTSAVSMALDRLTTAAPLDAMASSSACPSCRQPMEAQRFTSNHGLPLELDICYPCQGMWFDRYENLKLTADSVVELFRLLHERRAEQHQPLSPELACPRCVRPLEKGFDLVRSGRYITFRCAGQHGRFSSFSSFMIEKGFVRPMTRPEVEDLAKRVGAIYCTSCGAPVDIRKDHACPYCRAAFSLLDPQAVTRALEGYAQASAKARAMQATTLVTVGDTLVATVQDRSRAAERGRQQGAFTTVGGAPTAVVTGDLLAAGVEMVWSVLQD
jgi:Zn-finger nucleic acid-binding protein